MRTNTFHAKKVLVALFAILLPLVASAQTQVEIDGFWYNLESETLQAEVTNPRGTDYSGSITIPATVTYDGVAYSVTSIGEAAFDDCSSLTAITCHAVTPPTIASYTFKGVDKGIPVYVPAGSVEAYKAAAYWNEFTNYVGIETGIENPEIRNHKSEITFDLHGRRVATPTKDGIYIVDGKKVMVKIGM